MIPGVILDLVPGDALELGGVFFAALSGGLAAVRKRFDLVGVLVLAWVAGLGGGLLRDVLIGAIPPVGISDWRLGVFVVFLAGPPAFRKYSATGVLEFERTIQGRELDALVLQMPAQWPRRRVDDISYPVVPPMVRTAAVDRQGRLDPLDGGKGFLRALSAREARHECAVCR